LVRPRAAATGLSAAALVLLTACSSAGSNPASGASTPAGSSPRQALLAAAIQAHRVTSVTESLAVHTGDETTTGTIQVQLKPALRAAATLTVAAGGKNLRIKEIITDRVIYLHIPQLTRQLGKPWAKIDLSALKGAGTAFAQLLHGVQNNEFANQTQLLTAAKNVRVIGRQPIDGEPTTEYAGTINAAAALRALAPAARKSLAPMLRQLGDMPISFHAWIDGQHRTRKLTEVQTINGQTVSTSVHTYGFNQPVHIALPPASQTATPPGL
jgi:LppX_LprAFG lipoprotein